MSGQLPISNARVVKLLSRAKFVVSVLLLFRQNNDCDHHHITGCIKKKKKTNTDSRKQPRSDCRGCVSAVRSFVRPSQSIFFSKFLLAFFFPGISFFTRHFRRTDRFSLRILWRTRIVAFEFSTTSSQRLERTDKSPWLVRSRFVRVEKQSFRHCEGTDFGESAHRQLCRNAFFAAQFVFEKFLDTQRQCIRVDIIFALTIILTNNKRTDIVSWPKL